MQQKEQESGSSERAEKFVPLSSKENTAEEQGGAPQEKWRSHIQETGGAKESLNQGGVLSYCLACVNVLLYYSPRLA